MKHLSKIIIVVMVLSVVLTAFVGCEALESLKNLLPTPHEHNFVDGECECGEKDPDYVAPHEHVYVDGRCECGAEDPDYVAPHEHVYVDGRCECGAEDPDYVAPHEHVYVDGECECGEKDPDYVAPHEHVYVDGKCECGAEDPNVPHEHSYEETVTAPTCTEIGYTTYTCSCGDSYVADEVPVIDHTYVQGKCSCGSEDPNYSSDYYLVGWINGADVGSVDDSANFGPYKFVDGTLKAKFTSDSYVFVKLGDSEGTNLKWYMSSSYVTDKTATLVDTTTGTAEKMFIPGNVDVTFTLTVNENGTLTLVADYTVVDTGNHTYTIAGDNTALFGSAWDAANSANDMTYDASTGLWTISYTNSSSSTIWPNFKICQDHGWSKCWGAAAAGISGADNAWVEVGAGKTLTITFNAETEKITLTVK